MPMMSVSMSSGNVPKGPVITETPQVVLSQQMNKGFNGLLAFNQAEDQKADKTLEAQAKAIDAYFKAHDMPLEGTGMKMAVEAQKNNIDWRLLPAIAARESTGGKHACKKVAHSFMGWGSCKISFKSDEEAIEIVANNLGGNNPNTDQHYAGKTTKEILRKYNSVIPKYVTQVITIMDEIGDETINVDQKAQA